MTRHTESDETYCSDLEKEDQNPIRRRSKRLSQRSLLPSFRSNTDPATQRLFEIYQMLKCGKLCPNWLYDEWQAQKLEVEILKNTLKGKQKGRISFILKQINKHLQNSSSMNPEKSPVITNPYQNEKEVNSPNILAGMMTEVLTEIPPYQPQNLFKVTNTTVKNTEQPSIALTQRNPLDLTKKYENGLQTAAAVARDKVDFSERQIQEQHPAKIKTPIRPVSFEQERSSTSRCISSDSMIELIEADAIDRENIPPEVKVKERTVRQRSPTHVSKWLKFLPTPERPTYPVKPKSTYTTAPRKDSKSFKESIVNLYKCQPLATASIPKKSVKPITSSCSKKPKQVEKLKSSPIRSRINENLKQKSYRNTESIARRNRKDDLPRITPRNVQSEHFTSISPNFLFDEFSDLNNDNDSEISLTPSCREGFKKIFGTDNLNDFFKFNDEENHDEIVYKLKENHVRRLATILNVNHDILKKTIEGILSNEHFEDENVRSDSSVVECSQSPPQRLFPSQRSQISK